jgi:hypothetical protein
MNVLFSQCGWQHISPEMTVNAFKKCCISNVMGETDGNMVWNGSEEHVHLRCECVEDEGNDCENGENTTDR